MTSAVGYKGEAKSKATEVMMMNSRQEPMSKKERIEQQEALKKKVNQLFDLRASDPMTINKLKRSDSIFDKVKNLNENYFGGRDSLKKKKQEAIAEVDEEENEKGGATGAQNENNGLLTTEGADEEANNVYFKNIPIPQLHGSGGIHKDEDPTAKEDTHNQIQEEKALDIIADEDSELTRQILYDKSRRSLSMINPR